MTEKPDSDAAVGGGSIDPKRLLKVLEKTSTFRGLPLEQAQRLLGICEIGRCAAGEVLYKEDSPSTEMFVLLSGRLAVRKGGRAVIAEITPVDIVGEMGALTGQARSAQVVVIEDAMGLTIQKHKLDILLKQDADLDRRISKNIIGILCQKIREDGTRLAEYECIVAHLEKQVATLSPSTDQDRAPSETETVHETSRP